MDPLQLPHFLATPFGPVTQWLCLLLAFGSPPSWAAQTVPETILTSGCSSLMLPTSSADYQVLQTPVKVSDRYPQDFMLEQYTKTGSKEQKFLFYGTIDEDDGRLTIDFLLVDHNRQIRSAIRGKQAFEKMMNHLNPDKIRYVHSDWSPDSNNHQAFVRKLLEGASVTEAATSTWTGLRLAPYGLTRVRELWFEPKSVKIAQAILDGYEAPSLEHYSINLAFVRPEDLTLPIGLNGPLMQTLSEDESEIWLHDLVFGYRLGMKFRAAQMEILEDSIVSDEKGFSQALTDLQLLAETLHSHARSGRSGRVSVLVPKALYKGLSGIRPISPQDIQGGLQISVIGKIAAKFGMLIDSVAPSRGSYEVTFR
ncbi:MAG: hypothetical protein AAF202_02030 [Pseudomonadota bacterium]